jgi:hypothetical protein
VIPLLAMAASPLIKSLMEKGLSAIAGAVANKGKEYVETKLGVKLEDNISDAAATSLRELEIEHSEFLTDAALEGRRLDLEEAKVAAADTDSARELGGKLAQSQYWLTANIVPILALITILGGSFMLLTSKDADVKMAAVSFIMLPLGYYFGSSSGSKAKQEVIERMSK